MQYGWQNICVQSDGGDAKESMELVNGLCLGRVELFCYLEVMIHGSGSANSVCVKSFMCLGKLQRTLGHLFVKR